MTEPRYTASTITSNALDELYAERDRARHALRHLLRHLPSHTETEEQHVDRTPPDSVRQLVDALADALPDWAPAEERDFVWRHYQLTHRVLTRRVAQTEERAENFEGRAKAMEQRAKTAERSAELADAVTAETKRLMQRRTTTLRHRAEEWEQYARRFYLAWKSARRRAQRRNRSATHRLAKLDERRQQIRELEQRAEKAERNVSSVARALARGDRYRTAWRNARQRARVMSDELTRRAPLTGQYAAALARVREALASLHRTMAHDPRDWALDKRDAWLWGIVCGWECEAQHDHDVVCGRDNPLRQVAARHRWPNEDVERLKTYRRAVAALDGPAVPAATETHVQVHVQSDPPHIAEAIRDIRRFGPTCRG
ncbi:hypothetical protein [Streptomyces sp. NPDC050388]|uniref:hypothetical protein n=1 Tax=Streptomyces sp. NPDC050388 TaxID=3155781 RepID=UPI00342827CA